MITNPRHIFLLLLTIGTASAMGQAPKISYSTPQVYTVGTAITPLSPTNTGGATPQSVVTLASGLNSPNGVAFDASGNVYVAENGSNVVLKIPAGGGTPVVFASGFKNPSDVALDAAGNVYVADANNNEVKEIPVGGGSVIVLGSGFNAPYALTLDAAGNIYVADFFNNAIKKIPAGNGTPVVVASGFNGPDGVAIDAAGNIYVSDQYNNAIKKIPAGTHTAVTLCSAFGNPSGVAVDASGNVYFSDTNNSSIIELPAGGGGIVALGSGLSGAIGPDVTSAGIIYVSDGGAVKQIDPGPYSINPSLPAGLSFNATTGTISGTPTSASAATNYTVTAFDSSGTGNTILKITVNLPAKPIISYTTPQVYTAASQISPLSPVVSGGPIPPSGAFLISPALPSGLSMDPNTGIISGTPTSASAATNYTITATNLGGSGTAALKITVNLPPRPIISYGTPQVYTTFTAISSLSPVNSGGAVYPTAGYLISPALPSGLSMDTNTGIISGTPTVPSAAANYTVTATNLGGSCTAVIKITVNPYTVPVISYSSPQIYTVGIAISPLSPTNTGGAVAEQSAPLTLASALNKPNGVAFDASGNVYVAENGSNVVLKIPAGGGTPVVFASGFKNPSDVALDAAGNVYVADANNNEVKEIPVGGGSVIVLGSGFNAPYALTLDAAGNIYVADFFNNAIKKIPAGNGTPVVVASGFNGPDGVAIDAAGNIYVSDQYNNAIKKIPAGTHTAVTLCSAFGNPSGVAVDAYGNVYFSDTNYSSIAELPAGGSSIVPVGSGLSGAIGPDVTSAGTVYVSDGSTVKQINPSGYFISPALPAGLIMSPTTGIISGTPTNLSPATNYTVKAYNIGGFGSTTVNIAVTNAGLSNLTLSSGTLTPAFATNITGYTAVVADATTSVKVTPTLSYADATVKVNGTGVASGTASGSIPLGVGTNTIAVVVTAPDGVTTRTYKITVGRGAANAALSKLGPSIGGLTPTFSSGTTSYIISTGNANALMTLKPVSSDPNATIRVNGTTVASGTTTALIPLAEGGQTVISTVVTAQNDTTTKTYTLTVTRAVSTNATLSNLQPNNGTLSPVFASGTTSYTASVANAVSTISVTPTATDANATIKVNGTAVSSGTASGAIELAEGAQTVITTVVTAQNGATTKTYTLTVTRAPSANASLSKLGPSIGGLTPAFSSGTTSYSISAGNATASIKLTPVSSDVNATIKVNGTAVASGTMTAPIALAVGPNTITTVVTAQNGTTTKTYTLMVTRASGGADSYVPIANDGVLVHQAVSPNGDGVNDFLQIDNISQYPDNKLMIINRNGQLVYEASGYDNSSKVFDGHSNKNGQMQLPGTYFYQLDYSVSGIAKHKTGFIVLKY